MSGADGADECAQTSQQEVEIEESPEEARLNRGIVTVFEQTKESDTFDVGDRYLSQGYDEEVYMLDEEKEDFVVQAVPIAHIELPWPMTDEEYRDWVESDAGKLALSPFFEGLDHHDMLTEWGEERELMEGSA